MIETIAKHLQVLEGKSRKETFDILFNLGNISKDFRYLLSVTHSEHLRNKLKEAYSKVTPGHSTYTLKEAIQRLLTVKHSVTLPEALVYTIYKVVNHVITPSMYTNLQAALQYREQREKPEQTHFRSSSVCNICGRLTTKPVCVNCMTTLQEFTEYRRDNFKVGVNYFNFSKIVEGSFQIEYKDWLIERASGSEEVQYRTLLGPFGLMEQYPLPFEEYQKKDLR